jgi:alpha-tubulin suppressor-like RCC1 family protein
MLHGCLHAQLEERGSEACHDSRDNDDDGLTDCADPDCQVDRCLLPREGCGGELEPAEPPTFAVAENRVCSIEKGALYCWGASFDDASSSLPSRVGVKSDWRTVAVSSRHACAIDAEGKVYCWGADDSGQLGTAESSKAASPKAEPLPVATSVRFRDVRVGDAHTCALTDDGKIFCWGKNEHGQLGGGDAKVVRGALLEVKHQRKWRRIALGPAQSCAIDHESELYCWGTWQGLEPDVRAPSARFSSTCAEDISTSGTFGCLLDRLNSIVSCFGENDHGEQGQGDTVRTLGGELSGVKLAPWPVFALTTGARHACAIGEHTGGSKDGTDVEVLYDALTCWGDNSQGQRGSDETWIGDVVVADGIVEVHAGGATTCVRKKDGTLWCTGDNRKGQCGIDLQVMSTFKLLPVQGLPVAVKL